MGFWETKGQVMEDSHRKLAGNKAFFLSKTIKKNMNQIKRISEALEIQFCPHLYLSRRKKLKEMAGILNAQIFDATVTGAGGKDAAGTLKANALCYLPENFSSKSTI